MADNQNKKINNWLIHVKSVSEKNPGLKYKDLLVLAKQSYKKPSKSKSTDNSTDNSSESKSEKPKRQTPGNALKTKRVKKPKLAKDASDDNTSNETNKQPTNDSRKRGRPRIAIPVE